MTRSLPTDGGFTMTFDNGSYVTDGDLTLFYPILKSLRGRTYPANEDVASELSINIASDLGIDAVTMQQPENEAIVAALEIIGLIHPAMAEKIALALQATAITGDDSPPLMQDITQFDFGHTVVQQVRSQFR